jgi:Fe-S-cluster-containing dehydrogenase component
MLIPAPRKQRYFIIDIAKCRDCHNCSISCNGEHEGNDWPGYTVSQPKHGHVWMEVIRTERGQFPVVDVAYRPTPCMQCQEAPCVMASGGAISRRPDGIVIIDVEKALGRKDLIAACPYGSIYWNAERAVPQKCTLCAHLLDDGYQQPRCVQSCFTGALRVEHLEETQMARLVQAEGLAQIHPEWGTRPNTYYKNLFRFDKVFIAGSAALRVGDFVDCAKGAKARLFRGQELLAEVMTDACGDFKFDQLEEDSGVYAIEVSLDGDRSGRVLVELGKSRNVGIVLIDVVAVSDG